MGDQYDDNYDWAFEIQEIEDTCYARDYSSFHEFIRDVDPLELSIVDCQSLWMALGGTDRYDLINMCVDPSNGEQWLPDQGACVNLIAEPLAIPGLEKMRSPAAIQEWQEMGYDSQEMNQYLSLQNELTAEQAAEYPEDSGGEWLTVGKAGKARSKRAVLSDKSSKGIRERAKPLADEF